MSVTVYTLPNCVQCETTKRALEKNNISYDTVDMSVDKAAAQKVMDLGYKSAPVVFAGEDHWSGFRFDKIRGLTVA